MNLITKLKFQVISKIDKIIDRFVLPELNLYFKLKALIELKVDGR